jgi:hypothetical protein
MAALKPVSGFNSLDKFVSRHDHRPNNLTDKQALSTLVWISCANLNDEETIRPAY